MKNAKIYIIYIVVVLVLSYAFTYAMRIWQYKGGFDNARPFLEIQYDVESWKAAEGLTLHDFGTFSMGLPDEDMQMISIPVAPNGTVIEPFFLISANSGSFKFSQPTSVDIQKQDMEKLKSLKPDDENVQSSVVKDYDYYKSMLDVKELGYFEYLKLDENAVKAYIEKVNEKVNFIQKAKDIVLFETEDLNGVLIQIEGVVKHKDEAVDEGKSFANAEVTVWSKTGDITQKFFVTGKPGELGASIELIKKVIPSINYAGREIQTLDKQMPACLNAIKNLEWFKYLKLKMPEVEGPAVPANPVGENEVTN